MSISFPNYFNDVMCGGNAADQMVHQWLCTNPKIFVVDALVVVLQIPFTQPFSLDGLS